MEDNLNNILFCISEIKEFSGNEDRESLECIRLSVIELVELIEERVKYCE